MNSIWLPGVPQPGPQFPLSPGKEKRDLDLYLEIPLTLPPPWCYCIQHCRQSLELPAQCGPRFAFPPYSIYRCFQEICSRQVKKEVNFLVFLYINISSLVSTSMCDSFSIQDVHLNRHEVSQDFILNLVRLFFKAFLWVFFHSGNLTTQSVWVQPNLRGTILEVTSNICLLFMML